MVIRHLEKRTKIPIRWTLVAGWNDMIRGEFLFEESCPAWIPLNPDPEYSSAQRDLLNVRDASPDSFPI